MGCICMKCGLMKRISLCSYETGRFVLHQRNWKDMRGRVKAEWSVVRG